MCVCGGEGYRYRICYLIPVSCCATPTKGIFTVVNIVSSGKLHSAVLLAPIGHGTSNK